MWEQFCQNDLKVITEDTQATVAELPQCATFAAVISRFLAQAAANQ